MEANTGKVIYRSLVLCNADNFQPILDINGQIITKPNVPEDIDYFPTEFNEIKCPLPEIPQEPDCPFSIIGTSLDSFNPTYNTIILGISSNTINKIGVEVLKEGNIIYTIVNLEKNGDYFHIRLNKQIVGNINLRVVVEATNCILTTNFVIDVAPPTTPPPSTETTQPPVQYECFENYSLYRKIDAEGPDILSLLYHDCNGIEQQVDLVKGAPAECKSYQYRGLNSFRAKYAEDVGYLGSNLILGVLGCGEVQETTSTSTSTSTTSTSTTTAPCPEKLDMPVLWWRGQSPGIPYTTRQAAEMGASNSSGFGGDGQASSVYPNVGNLFYKSSDFADCSTLEPGWYWYSFPFHNSSNKVVTQITEGGFIETVIIV